MPDTSSSLALTRDSPRTNHLPIAAMYTPPQVYRTRRRTSTIPHKRPHSFWQYLAYLLLAVVGSLIAVWVTLVMQH